MEYTITIEGLSLEEADHVLDVLRMYGVDLQESILEYEYLGETEVQKFKRAHLAYHKGVVSKAKVTPSTAS